MTECFDLTHNTQQLPVHALMSNSAACAISASGSVCQGDTGRTNKSIPGEFSLGAWEASPEQMRGLEIVAKSSKSGDNSCLLL